ncbi:hypothetical protein M9980_01970 [Sphingomonas donggukensis]|uniref:Secreted protein n=1 Tax=Sphingomonas donggukensis TaxID=2949093 RepID=A0ABY4TWE0_9SPHN|nr:hypothetical protein [Sphingomonas donggukensis]URW76021.1 hypothetical protein M9980_01970 [Sphingomonas donggukensis]
MMLLWMALAAQAVPGTVLRPDKDSDVIVVIARDTRKSKAALDACIRRKCPPQEDIAATITHAENQFIDGDFENAWATLRRSRGRNDRYASTLPKSVSGLRQFSADMATVLGEPDLARVGTIDSLSALKAKKNASQADLELKRLEIGDAFARQSNLEAATTPLPLRSRLQMAVSVYDAVAKRAAEARLPDVQGRAMLRSASLFAQLASDNAMYRQQANRRIAALRATTDPAMQTYREAAEILVARAAYDRGDPAPIERLLDTYPSRTRSPMLVVAPRLSLGEDGSCVDAGANGPDVQDQWIDYDFVIDAGGRVGDIVERRRGKHADGAWINVAQSSLRGRRYLPLEMAQGMTGVSRRERFVLVADRATKTGTRIASGCGPAKIITVDLTGTITSASRS